MDIRLLLLSLAVGFVDAVAFVQVGAFPANMTGNSVLLALSLARLDVPGITLSGIALLGFIVGAATGARLVHAPDHAWSRRTNAVLLLAGGLLLAVTLPPFIDAPPLLSTRLFFVALAMGLQSAAIQHLAIPGIATVFVTGTLTTAISRLAVAGHPPKAALSEPPAQWLPALSWLSYFAGAFLGALQTRSPYPFLLALPGLILLGVALRRPREQNP